jgi:hypothetical protein
VDGSSLLFSTSLSFLHPYKYQQKCLKCLKALLCPALLVLVVIPESNTPPSYLIGQSPTAGLFLVFDYDTPIAPDFRFLKCGSNISNSSRIFFHPKELLQS